MNLLFVVAILSIWPFSAPNPPACGDRSECIVISKPATIATSGVSKPIARVYRNGKNISFTVVSEPTLGPAAVRYTLNKTNSQPETIQFVWK